MMKGYHEGYWNNSGRIGRKNQCVSLKRNDNVYNIIGGKRDHGAIAIAVTDEVMSIFK